MSAPVRRIAHAPDDASPSRARLGRVAELLRGAEEATPRPRRHGHQDRDTGAVVPLL